MTDEEYKTIQKRMYLSDVGNRIYKWVKAKGEEYKNKGALPLSLADYYTNPEDVEIAAIVEVAIPDPLENTARRLAYITELHNLLGDNPSEFVRSRKFLHELLPKGAMDAVLGGTMGIQKSDVFNILDWIWEVKNTDTPLETAFTDYAFGKRRFGPVPDFGERVNHNVNKAAVQAAMMKLCLADGIGKGVWKSVSAEMLPCPMISGLRKFLRHLYPIGLFKDEESNEIITFIGYDVPCDFVYAYLSCKNYKEEMATIGWRLRNVVNGVISRKTWWRNYKWGLLFTPERSEELAKMRRIHNESQQRTRAELKKRDKSKSAVKDYE